ncbi:23S rRNA (uracil(1939)-C(5))-methyltransferase RlmD [Halopseudomonas bauzanensis]|uniref:23S rRNA (uracil(1939)-C(5))-methyltransferase RlmD n=1 Tax=Halopseudomonas bauzanensis TaxID=653930 RepID=UPI0025578B8A|nr:23S rRNA (uracil(1939)-C(5))-methyltransferase RlmD [Halopseudomonas bauzanensis]
MNRSRGKPRRAPDAPAAIGQRIELTLERLTHDGRGIGRWQGRTVFAEGGLPGEKVDSRVVRARSKLIETRVSRVLETSPERLQPACPHFALCGGCSLQHMSRQTQLDIKQQALAQQLQHFAGLQPERWMPALTGADYGYRQRTRLSMRWDRQAQRLVMGYRQRASSELVELAQCPVLVPVLDGVLRELPTLLQQLDARAGLGHIELIAGEHPSMVVRYMQPLSAADIDRLHGLATAHGLVCRLQPEAAGPAQALQADAPEPAYRLADQQLTFRFAAGDFTQVNAEINQQMVNQALDWLALQPGERVLDLFCGVGNFALPMARTGALVTGVEGSAEMVERAGSNARLNELTNAHFFQADLSKPEAIQWQDDYQAALLDPPRDGAAELVAVLARRKLRRILYVSCNPATLARDAGILAEAGYRLVQAGIMDMFPQTAHVEAMALFVSGEDKT